VTVSTCAVQLASRRLQCQHLSHPFPSLSPFRPEPSSPPEGVQLVPVDSTSLRLVWGLPPKLGRNGIITRYIVECMEVASVQSPMTLPSPTFDTPTTVEQLLTGLTFFTNYSCKVAAANVNGSGPFSAWVTATTPEGCELWASHWYIFPTRSPVYILDHVMVYCYG